MDRDRKSNFFIYRNYFLIYLDETVMEPASQTVNVAVKVDKHLGLALQVMSYKILEVIIEIIV